jgi:hypothetical protein
MIRVIAAAAAVSVLLPVGAASAQGHDPVGPVKFGTINYGSVVTVTTATAPEVYKLARGTVCTEITYRLTNASTSPLPISFQLVDLATGLKSAWVTAFPGYSATASLTPAHRVVAFDKIGNGPVRYAPATTYPTLGCS